MDPTRPDELSKALATPVSRRQALKALAALARASGLAALPPNSLEIAGLVLAPGPLLPKKCRMSSLAAAVNSRVVWFFPIVRTMRALVSCQPDSSLRSPS
jgi:hypothetical protein